MRISYEKWNGLFVLSVLIYIIIQAAFPGIEKKILWGEFFVLLAALSVLKIRFNPRGYQKYILAFVSIWMLVFPLYGIFISKIYSEMDFNPFYLIRHAVFFYYAIFFFFAFKYAPLIVEHLKNYAKLLVVFVPVTPFLFGSSIGFPPLFGWMLMGVAKRFEKRSYFYLTLLIVCGLLFYGSGGGTGKVLMAFLVGFIAANYIASLWTKFVPSRLSRVLIVSVFVFFIFFAVKFIIHLYQLTTMLALLGDSISSLAPMSRDFNTDLSGLWRPVLWSHLYGRFMEYPWGIGLGTPLFEKWLDGFVMLHLYKEGENYVQGAHNSFVTFIARLGIPCLVLFTMTGFYLLKMTNEVLKRFRYQPFNTRDSRVLSSALLAFVFTCICSSFNVLLESPLYAGGFWFSFGLFTRLFGDYLLIESPVKVAVSPMILSGDLA